MTGPDRYTDAIACLADYHRPDHTGDERIRLLLEGLVHAVLAQTAAMALPIVLAIGADAVDNAVDDATAATGHGQPAPTNPVTDAQYAQYAAALAEVAHWARIVAPGLPNPPTGRKRGAR